MDSAHKTLAGHSIDLGTAMAGSIKADVREFLKLISIRMHSSHRVDKWVFAVPEPRHDLDNPALSPGTSNGVTGLS